MNKELIAKLRMAAGTEISKLHQNKVFTDQELLQLSNLLIPPLNGGNGVFDEFMRKYTELIVRECISVVDSLASPDDSDDYFWTVQNTSSKLKEHFGVEE